MKREFLQGFLVEDKPLPKEMIDAIMAENGRDIQKAKAGFADYEQLKQDLEQLQKENEMLRAQDFESAQQAVKDWEEKYNQAVASHQQALAQAEFDHQLQLAVHNARGRNLKAITALLDVDHLKNCENQQQAISDALEQLKQDSGYLFEMAQTPPPYAQGTGTQAGVTKTIPGTLAGALREKYERK